MAKDKASIYVDLQQLMKVLYKGQFTVDKRDRIALFNRMFEHCENAISYFSIAYQVRDKIKYIELMLAEFEVLKMECRMAIDLDILKQQSTINQVRELIVKIQEGIDKWRLHVCSARQE